MTHHLNLKVIREPYTLPPQEEEEPDCSELFASVLRDFAEFLGANHLESLHLRVASLQVMTGTMTPTEASRLYGVDRTNIYRHVKRLCWELDIPYQRGK